MRFHLGEIADVADVVALAVFVEVFPMHGFAREGGDFFEGLKNGNAIGPSAADIVHFAAAWGLEEGMHEADHVQAVDVIPDLFALVAKDVILAFS